MFRSYMWVIFRLRSNLLGAAIRDVWVVLGVLGVGWGEGRYLVPIAGTMSWGYNEISSLPPPPNPQCPQNTPHILYSDP